MELSEKTNLLKAIIQFQGECPPIPKEKKVDVYKNGKKIYEYFYAPHEIIMKTIQPVLKSCELGIIHQDEFMEGRVAVRTTLFHSSGETVDTVCNDSIIENLGLMTHIQSVGKMKTFIKRFNIGDLLNLSVADDTGSEEDLGKDTKKKKITKPEITDYKQEDKKEEPKPNPNYIYDEKLLRRYNKNTHNFDEHYQKTNSLILSKEWQAIETLLKSQKVESKVFLKWLAFAYKDEQGKGRKFYDIKQDECPHIMDVLNGDIEQILDIPEK
jgi:hypothetical protein